MLEDDEEMRRIKKEQIRRERVSGPGAASRSHIVMVRNELRCEKAFPSLSEFIQEKVSAAVMAGEGV
eukprot:763635-Hanusia_phi.AAC.1